MLSSKKQLFPVLAACAFVVLAAEESRARDACLVRSANVVESMPPLRSQDGTSLCYVFAATALLQHEVCEARRARGEGPCRYGAVDLYGAAKMSDADFQKRINSTPDDRISTIDVAAIGNRYSERGGGVLGLGDSAAILKNLGREGSVAFEKCAPFDRVISSLPRDSTPWKEVTSYNIREFYWSTMLKRLHKQYHDAKRKCPCQDGRMSREQYYAQEIKRLVNLETDVQQVAQALREPLYARFLQGVLFPKECENQRMSFAAFQPTEFRVSRPAPSEKDAEKKVGALISVQLGTLFKAPRPKPVVLNLCSTPRAQAGKNSSFNDCSAHALVVSGARERCCGGRCSRQLRIYDSLRTFYGAKGAVEEGGDLWVDEEVVLERSARFVTSTAFGPSRSVLVWIEKEPK